MLFRVQNVLQDLDEEEGCLGRRMESFDSVEAEVSTFPEQPDPIRWRTRVANLQQTCPRSTSCNYISSLLPPLSSLWSRPISLTPVFKGYTDVVVYIGQMAC